MSSNEGLSDRIKNRMKNVRTVALESIIQENRKFLKDVNHSLSELEKNQESNPILLRLVQEMYDYIQKDGEVLSDVVADLRHAKTVAEKSRDTAELAVPDIAGTEMMVKESWLYYEREPATVQSFVDRVDLPVFQEALENTTPGRWMEIMDCVDKAKANRK